MTTKPRTSVTWWLLHVVHNCVAHPFLVVGELADVLRVFLKPKVPFLARLFSEVTSLTHALHDKTIPEGDAMNQVRLK